jgi:hypothetical protein
MCCCNAVSVANAAIHGRRFECNRDRAFAAGGSNGLNVDEAPHSAGKPFSPRDRVPPVHTALRFFKQTGCDMLISHGNSPFLAGNSDCLDVDVVVLVAKPVDQSKAFRWVDPHLTLGRATIAVHSHHERPD